MSKILDLVFKLNAVTNNFGSKFNAAAKNVTDLQQKISRFQKITAQVNAYKKQSQALTEITKKLNANGWEDKQLLQQYQAQERSLNRLGEALKKSGFDINNFAQAERNLINNSQQASDSLARLEAAQSRLSRIKANLSWGNIRGVYDQARRLVEPLRQPLKVSMDFESAMQSVKAAGITLFEKDAEAFIKLREQAIKLGAETSFTSIQAANAQENLIRAGYKPDQVLQAMPALLDMSAAESIPLDQASNIVASLTSAFGYEADQTRRIADVLAMMSASAKTNIPDLASSMFKAAPLAASLGMKIEDLAAYLAAMQQNGVEVSTSGTSFKTGLLRLTALAAGAAEMEDEAGGRVKTNAARDSLASLGVTLATRDGRLRRVEDILADLNAAFDRKGWGEKDIRRSNVLENIFGKNSLTAWNALLSSGALTNQLVDAAYNQRDGRASIMAQTKLDSLQGQLTIFQSAWQGFQQNIGDMINPLARDMLKWLTDGLSEINRLIREFPTESKVVAGFIATLAAIPVAKGLASIVSSLVALPGAIKAVSALSGAAGAAGAGGAVSVIKSLAGAGEAVAAGGNAANTAITAAGASASTAITAGGASAGASLLAGAAALGAVAGAIYLQYKSWSSMTPEQRRLENAATVASPEAARRTRERHYTPATGGRNRTGITPHATGGIMTTPHIGLVAEAGPEAIVPLRDKPRGIQVLMQAAQRLGILRENYNSSNNFMTRSDSNNEFANTSSYVLNRTNSNNNFTSSPVINITVNASESGSSGNDNLASMIANKVREVIENIANDSMRLSYA